MKFLKNWGLLIVIGLLFVLFIVFSFEGKSDKENSMAKAREAKRRKAEEEAEDATIVPGEEPKPESAANGTV